MQKLFFIVGFLLTSLVSLAQTSDANLTLQADTIKSSNNFPPRNGNFGLAMIRSRMPNVIPVTSGTNAYVVAITPGITTYTSGLVFFVYVTNPNSGSSTINVNSIGVKNIYKLVSGTPTVLSGGDLPVGPHLFYYDGTQMIIAVAASGGGGGGITNSAAATEFMMSDGVNATGSGVFVPAPGAIQIGDNSSSITGGSVSIRNSTNDATLILTAQGQTELSSSTGAVVADPLEAVGRTSSFAPGGGKGILLFAKANVVPTTSWTSQGIVFVDPTLNHLNYYYGTTTYDLIPGSGTNEIQMTNSAHSSVSSGLFADAAGNLNLGTGLSGSSRTINSAGSASNISIELNPKGTAGIDFNFAGPQTISMNSGGMNMGGTAINGLTSLQSNTGQILSLSTSNTSGSTPSTSVNITSGSSVNGNSGDITFIPGTPSGSGTAGKIKIYGTATNGYVLTASGTDGTAIWSPASGGGSSPPFDAQTAILMDHTDNTKLLKFNLSAFSTSTTNTLTPPNYSGTIATLAGTETLTNKTLTSPVLTTPNIGTATGSVSGNAGTATALATGRTIGLTGDVTGTSASFDGSGNVTAPTTVVKINGTSLAGLATGILKNTTTTGVPSIAAAGTDYQAPITLTTTGTSGAATFISNTLNIPQYSGGGSGEAALSPTAVKTSNYSASVLDFVPCDISGGGFAVTLPSAPADGSRIGIKLSINSATPTSNVLTVVAGGLDVFDLANGNTSFVMLTTAQSIVLQYKSSTGIWYAIYGDLPKSKLNNQYVNRNAQYYQGKTIVWFGDSYTAGSNASPVSLRFSSLVSAALGATESNFGLAGSTMMFRTPTDYQGALSGVERTGSIPSKTASLALLVCEYGLNDMGQTAAAYTTANYITDYTTFLNAALTAGWLPSQILLIPPAYIGSAGYTQYATITGNTAPTAARHQSFVTATETLAKNFGCLYFNLYNDQWNNDQTLLSGTDHIHPTNAGYEYISNDLVQFLTGSPVYVGNVYANALISQGTTSGFANTAAKIFSISGNANLVNQAMYPVYGTNVGTSFSLIPLGTGFSSTQQTQFSLFNTDFVAGSTNYEALQIIAGGSTNGYEFNVTKGGSGSLRAINFQMNATTIASFSTAGDFTVSRSNSGSVLVGVTNTNASTGAIAGLALTNNSGDIFQPEITGSGFTTTGLQVARQATYVTTSSIVSTLHYAAGTGDEIWAIGGNATTNEVFRLKNKGVASFTQQVMTSAWAPALTITSGANTGMTASTEFNSTVNAGATWTWGSGTIPTQRFNYDKAFTIAGTSGTNTATNAYGRFTEAPLVGTNAAITNNYGIGTNGSIALTTAGNYIAIKEGSNAFMGQTTLVTGTKAVSISGLTTSDRCFTTLVTPTGTSLTTTYQCACTSGTATIQANIAAGTINTSDGSTVNYIIFRPTP